MTTSESGRAKESGIWYGDTSARESEVAEVARAVRNLGKLTLRVVQDPEEARGVVLGLRAADLRQKYPDASADDVAKAASSEADNFVRDMEPSDTNGQDPRRLIRVESTDGSPVLPHLIAEEIKFRVRPGLAQAPITAEEVVYGALSLADPATLLD